MMSEREGLLARIMHEPDVDLNRYVYADKLSDLGEDLRAEWIISQLRNETWDESRGDLEAIVPPYQSRKTFDQVSSGAGVLQYIGQAELGRAREHTATPRYSPSETYRRGFLQHITANRQFLLGGTCERCGGSGRVHACIRCGCHWRLNRATELYPQESWSLADTNQRGGSRCCDNVQMTTTETKCFLCMEGRIDANLVRIVAENPLESVYVRDVAPGHVTIGRPLSLGNDGRCIWRPFHIDPEILELMEPLVGCEWETESPHNMKLFPSVEEARISLSRAMIAHARNLLRKSQNHATT